MANELHLSDEMALKALEASDKLDQFLLGATVAVCAYVAQTNAYTPLGLNPSTLMVGCMFIFAVSGALGFRRLYMSAEVYLANALMVEAEDDGDEEKAARHLKTARKRAKSARDYGRCRNVLMFVGLAWYIATKVWAASICTGCIAV